MFTVKHRRIQKISCKNVKNEGMYGQKIDVKPLATIFAMKRGIYYYCANEHLCFYTYIYCQILCSSHIKWEVQTGFSWKEVFSLIKEGETYMSGDKHISLKNGHLSIGDSSGCMTLHDELFTKKKEERNLVDFAQALKAMQKGHIVYSDFNGFYYKVEDNNYIVAMMTLINGFMWTCHMLKLIVNGLLWIS